jgi:uroporphyrinogen-III synthase
MKRPLFISKNKNEIEQLINFAQENEIELIAHSFLQFEAIPFKIESTYDAVFFGSPRAVDFFLKQEKLHSSVYIGCVGEITAQSLQDKGYAAHFIGKSAGDTSKIGLEFKELVKDKKVLFPQSSISHRSIASLFPPDQINEISIYKTVTYPKSIPTCEYYIFTSPSNIDGFLLENQFPLNAKIIAWGKTTEKYLLEKNQTVEHTLKNSTVDELVDVLKKKKQ